jgi:predicted nucleic acid-binding protein
VAIGLDINILCYGLNSRYPEHEKVKDLLFILSPKKLVALNPTVLHETYHTIVYYSEWVPEEAARRLTALLRHPYIEFYNQTKNLINRPKPRSKIRFRRKRRPHNSQLHSKKNSNYVCTRQSTPKNTKNFLEKQQPNLQKIH